MGRPLTFPFLPGESDLDRRRRRAREKGWAKSRADGRPVRVLREWLPGETAEVRKKRLNAEKAAKWRAANPERAREIADRCAPARRESSRAWQKANPEKVAESAKRYRESHPDRRLAQSRSWRARNIEHAREWQREYSKKKYDSSPEFRFKILSTKNARRAQSAGGHVSKAEWDAIKDYFGHCCAYCLRKMTRLEIEHVTALSRGGDHSPENVVPACRSCNARKNNRGILSMLREAA
jgi:5-methylcytosine-specific restriction endonuclease McrA